MFFLFDFIYTLVTPSSKSCIDTKQKIKQISQEEAHDSISNVLEVVFFKDVSRAVWFGESWKDEECECLEGSVGRFFFLVCDIQYRSQ